MCRPIPPVTNAVRWSRPMIPPRRRAATRQEREGHTRSSAGPEAGRAGSVMHRRSDHCERARELRRCRMSRRFRTAPPSSTSVPSRVRRGGTPARADRAHLGSRSRASDAIDDVHGSSSDRDPRGEGRGSSLGFGRLDQPKYLGCHRGVNDGERTKRPAVGGELLELGACLAPHDDLANAPSNLRRRFRCPQGRPPNARG